MLGPLDLDVLREKLALLEVEEKEVSKDSPSTPQSKGSPTKDSKVGICRYSCFAVSGPLTHGTLQSLMQLYWYCISGTWHFICHLNSHETLLF